MKRLVRQWSLQSVETDDPLVALTYDDGPDPDQTPAILDVLDRRRTRATFFLLSEKATAHPAIVRRIRDAGHEIGLHGLGHRDFTALPWGESVKVIRRGRRQLEDVVGTQVRWFRPPFGQQDLLSFVAARASGLQVALWSASAGDWTDVELEQCVTTAVSKSAPGGILVLHDGFEPTGGGCPRFDKAVLLQRILDELDTRGWRAGSLGELVATRAPRERVQLRRRSR